MTTTTDTGIITTPVETDSPDYNEQNFPVGTEVIACYANIWYNCGAIRRWYTPATTSAWAETPLLGLSNTGGVTQVMRTPEQGSITPGMRVIYARQDRQREPIEGTVETVTHAGAVTIRTDDGREATAEWWRLDPSVEQLREGDLVAWEDDDGWHSSVIGGGIDVDGTTLVDLSGERIEEWVRVARALPGDRVNKVRGPVDTTEAVVQEVGEIHGEPAIRLADESEFKPLSRFDIARKAEPHPTYPAGTLVAWRVGSAWRGGRVTRSSLSHVLVGHDVRAVEGLTAISDVAPIGAVFTLARSTSPYLGRSFIATKVTYADGVPIVSGIWCDGDPGAETPEYPLWRLSLTHGSPIQRGVVVQHVNRDSNAPYRGGTVTEVNGNQVRIDYGPWLPIEDYKVAAYRPMPGDVVEVAGEEGTFTVVDTPAETGYRTTVQNQDGRYLYISAWTMTPQIQEGTRYVYRQVHDPDTWGSAVADQDLRIDGSDIFNPRFVEISRAIQPQVGDRVRPRGRYGRTQGEALTVTGLDGDNLEVAEEGVPQRPWWLFEVRVPAQEMVELQAGDHIAWKRRGGEDSSWSSDEVSSVRGLDVVTEGYGRVSRETHYIHKIQAQDYTVGSRVRLTHVRTEFPDYGAVGIVEQGIATGTVDRWTSIRVRLEDNQLIERYAWHFEAVSLTPEEIEYRDLEEQVARAVATLEQLRTRVRIKAHAMKVEQGYCSTLEAYLQDIGLPRSPLVEVTFGGTFTLAIDTDGYRDDELTPGQRVEMLQHQVNTQLAKAAVDLDLGGQGTVVPSLSRFTPTGAATVRLATEALLVPPAERTEQDTEESPF